MSVESIWQTNNGRVVFQGIRHFAKGELRGCNIEILPFLRLFPSRKYRGYHEGWTIHFGWLFWTVMIFTYNYRRDV